MIVVSSGQTLIGVSTTEAVEVQGGGLVLNSTLQGLTIDPGGSARNVSNSSGAVVVNGGMATELTVNFGTTNVTVGTGGVIASSLFSYNSPPVVVSNGGTVYGSVLQATTLEAASGATVAGIDITGAGELLLDGLAYVSGETASLDAGSNVLTVSASGALSTVQLGGHYVGQIVNLGPESGESGTVISSYDTSDLRFNELVSGPHAFFDEGATIALATITGLESTGLTDAGNHTFIVGDGSGNVDLWTTSNTISQGTAYTLNGAGQSLVADAHPNDTITVNNGFDQITTGSTGNYTVYLVNGTTTVASEGATTVYAGAGSDTIDVLGSTIAYGNLATLSFIVSGTLTLHTGEGSVTVQGGFGGGSFSGGTSGDNLLVAGTAPTTLYAGGSGDVLIASGASQTTMNGWGGNETFLGQYGSGLETFNFNGAIADATGGSGANTFNLGTAVANIMAGSGDNVFDLTSGASGGRTFIAGFQPGRDAIHLIGYAADEASHALATATTYNGAEVLSFRDGSSIGFGGVTGLTLSSFV